MATAESGVINFTDLTLTLVFRCNYRCPSCLVGDKLTSKEALSFDDAVAIIDSAASLKTFRSVAFVGGEPFLVYPLMVQISKYIFEKYGKVALSASTNSYWASSLPKTRAKVGPLVKYGLHSLLLSWDDFHAKFGKIVQVANAITVCNEFGVEPTVQNIVMRDSTRTTTIKETLAKLCDVSRVDWAESPCTPVGLGAELAPESHVLVDIDDLPYGQCTAGEILNIEANGDVKPCCGSGLMAGGLTMGNVRQDKIKSIVRRASIDPFFNSLVTYKGPKHLVDALRQAGRDDLVPQKVTDVCDACFKIADHPEAVSVLRSHLESKRTQLLMSRAASEEFSSASAIEIDEDASRSIFRRVPNFDRAEPIPRLNLDSTPISIFRNSYLHRHEPAVLECSLLEKAPLLKNWADAAYLKHQAGGEKVKVTVGMKNGNNIVEMGFATYLDRVTHGAYAVRGRDLYMAEAPVPDPLQGDIAPVVRFARGISGCDDTILPKRDLNLSRADDPHVLSFIGRYTYTDCHEHGGSEALMMQIAGCKEVILFRPTDENYQALHANSAKYDNWSPINMYRPDLGRFPLFCKNTPSYTIVRPGEILYIPDGWYHAVSTLGHDLTITATFFFPCVHFDLCAAPRWNEFKGALRSRSYRQRVSALMRLPLEFATMKSLFRRVKSGKFGG